MTFRYVALMLAALALAGCAKSDDRQLQGWVEAEAIFVSPDEQGRVEDLKVRQGDKVTKGALLFMLDDDLQKADVQMRQATLASARQAFARAQELLKSAAGTQKTMDDASAALQQAQANLDSAQTRLTRRRQLSPVTGSVEEVYYRPGETVQPGKPVVALLPPANLKIRFFAPERQLADIQWANTTPDGLTSQARYWIDDVWMIGSLQIQAWRVSRDPKYLDHAALMARLYMEKLQQPNGLFFHGPNARFHWGRGNGWVAAGLAELLSELPPSHKDYAAVMGAYQRMMAGLLANPMSRSDELLSLSHRERLLPRHCAASASTAGVDVNLQINPTAAAPPCRRKNRPFWADFCRRVDSVIGSAKFTGHEPRSPRRARRDSGRPRPPPLPRHRNDRASPARPSPRWPGAASDNLPRRRSGQPRRFPRPPRRGPVQTDPHRRL